MSRRYSDAAALLRWERTLAASTMKAYRRWLPEVRDAVLPSLALTAGAWADWGRTLTAAGELEPEPLPPPPPNPAAVAATQLAWETAVGATLVTDLDGLMAERMARALEDLLDAELVGPADAPTPAELRQGYLETVRNRMARTPDEVFRDISSQIGSGLDEGEGPGQLQKRVRQYLSVDDEGGVERWLTRANRVARTETTGAFNGSSHLASVHRQVATGEQIDKVWVATMDKRTRKTHYVADGQRRELEGRFNIGRDELRFPGDSSGSAREVVNCRCTTIEVLRSDVLPGETDDRQTERERSDGSTRDPAAEVQRRAEDGQQRARDEDNEQGDGSIQAAATTTRGSTMGKRMTWSGALAPLGKVTGDGRMLSATGEFAFREFPLPLQWAKAMEGGHYGAVVVGSIREASVVDGVIRGSGILFDTDEAAELAPLLAERVVRPSVDLADYEWDVVDEAGNPVTEDQMMAAWEVGEDIKLVERALAATIISATIVSTPAFAEALITITGEEVDDGARAGDDTAPDPTAVGPNDSAAGDKPVDEPAADPAAEPPAVPVPDDEAALVAAAAVAAPKWTPPLAAFEDPQLDGPTPLTVDPDGRVYGHLATWNTCHVGIADSCVLAPRSSTGYAYFHQAEVVTDRGTLLPVGHLTVGGGHASPGAGLAAAQQHYDDTGSTWAVVRAGEDEHGIYVTGLVDPDATQEQVDKGRRHCLSGDWRRVSGNLELVAGLSVVSGGFPVPRGAIGKRGQQTSLVAAGALPVKRKPAGQQHTGQGLEQLVERAALAAVRAYTRDEADRRKRAARAAQLREAAGTDPRARAARLRARAIPTK